MKTGKNLILIVTLIGLMLATAPLMAQAPPAGGPGSSNGPIDGGVFTLLFGALAYGYNWLKQNEVKDE